MQAACASRRQAKQHYTERHLWEGFRYDESSSGSGCTNGRPASIAASPLPDARRRRPRTGRYRRGTVTEVVVRNIAVSLDGFAAGPAQSLEHPLGVGAERLHTWIFETRFGRQMIGAEGGNVGIDNEVLERGDRGVGATIMGRNMFGPIRGDWPNADWRGWWGEEPPYHHPVFVLTHYAREPLEMQGGTTFYFVTDGIQSALDQAVQAAGGDVRIGGGVATIQQYMRAGLIDELGLSIVPTLLGRGERLFEADKIGAPNYECVEMQCSSAATHVRLRHIP
jgi:dihydrofolate reductase